MAPWRRVGLVAATFVLSLLFSGVIYGWNDMQLILEKEGVYCKSGCPDSVTAKYDTTKYNLVISVAEVRGRALCSAVCLCECYAVCGCGARRTGAAYARCFTSNALRRDRVLWPPSHHSAPSHHLVLMLIIMFMCVVPHPVRRALQAAAASSSA